MKWLIALVLVTSVLFVGCDKIQAQAKALSSGKGKNTAPKQAAAEAPKQAASGETAESGEGNALFKAEDAQSTARRRRAAESLGLGKK